MSQFEDRLDQAQRIRLEAIAQAANSLGAPLRPLVDPDALIARARTIEDFILGETDDEPDVYDDQIKHASLCSGGPAHHPDCPYAIPVPSGDNRG
jgi:hypothetical protein